MKRFITTFFAVAAVMAFFSLTALAQVDTTLITKWGFLGDSRIGNWKFVPGAAGGAGIAGTAALSVEWGALRGEFKSPLTATTEKAIVVTGKIEFSGNGFNSWSGLRYGVFYRATPETLITTNVDSTRWSGAEGNSASGYLFTPISGTSRATDGGWGLGTHGVRRTGNWISANGDIVATGTTRQKPARAVSTAGSYEFAMSVQPLANGTKEVRFYLIKGTAAQSTQSTYYFGGSFIDTTTIAPTFNGIHFAIHATGSGDNPTVRGYTLSEVKATLGAPITVPEAPWQDYYVDQWGFFGHRGAQAGWGGHRDVIGNWTFTPDPMGVIGNAGIKVSKDTASSIEWAVIRGGFVDPVTATVGKALNVTGKIEFTGNGFDSWSGLRYGLWYNDSAGTLIVDNAVDTINGVVYDSTRWTGREDNSRGYLLTPMSGTSRATDGAWGIGTHGVETGPGNWLSTNQGTDRAYGTSRQKPARAVSTAGVYEFALSVNPLANGTKEVRFYLIKGTAAQSTQSTYYFGATFIDTTSMPATFNGLIFGAHVKGSGDNPTFRGMKLTDVKVALGAPITVPVAPWSDYYVDQWGFLGGKFGGWHFVPGGVIGNAGVQGSAANTSQVVLRGEFVEPHEFPVGKALEVEGKVTFTGGGFANNTFGFGMFQSDSAGSLIVDSAVATLPDSTRWNGKETGNFGYLFIPSSSAIPWNSGSGTWGGVVNGIPYSPTNAGNYVIGSEVAGAAGTAGTYDFIIHVGRQTNGSNYVKYSFKKTGYTFEGQKKYDANASAAHKFNSIVFALKEGNTTTALNVADVKVKQVAEATTVPGETGLPTVYSLSQNYPNPFNPTTTIEFALPQSGAVHMVVYDVLGRMVTELVNNDLNAGYHKINFNASNLSSGIYFYSLKAGNFVSVKKLMLLK